MPGTVGGTTRPLDRPAHQRMRVAVIDEYPSQVEGVVQVIDGSPTMEVVITASSGHEALEKLDQAHPDVVLIEPRMRSGDGMSFAAQALREHPDITIIALSRLWDDDHVAESLGAGMAAHLPKTTPLDDLPALIRQTTLGAEVRPASSGGPAIRTPLTTRERDVLRLASRGLSNVDIGRELFVTEQTVKFHLQNAYRTLGARNGTEAAAIARRQGILS